MPVSSKLARHILECLVLRHCWAWPCAFGLLGGLLVVWTRELECITIPRQLSIRDQPGVCIRFRVLRRK